VCCPIVNPFFLLVNRRRNTENANYEGVRVGIRGSLGKTRITLQIDIGFGDLIIPEAEDIHYSSILGFPAPILKGYSKESMIAEKFEAQVIAEMESEKTWLYQIKLSCIIRHTEVR